MPTNIPVTLAMNLEGPIPTAFIPWILIVGSAIVAIAVTRPPPL